MPRTPGLLKWNRWIAAVLLAAAVLVPAWQRNGPADKSTFRYHADSAYHFRLVEHLLDHGKLPLPDPWRASSRDGTGLQPAPPLLYHLLAAGIRALRFFDPGLTADRALQLLIAFLGGLLAVPFYFWLRIRVPARTPALLGTWLLALSPPLVFRVSFPSIRFESFCLPLIIILLLILEHPVFPVPRITRHRGLLQGGLIAATALAGCGIWRLFPAIGSAVLALWLTARLLDRRENPPAALSLAWLAGTAAGGLLFTCYQQNLDSLLLLSPALLPFLMQLILFRPGWLRWWNALPSVRRWQIPAGLLLLAVLVSPLVVPVIRVRLELLLSPGPAVISSDSLYALLVDELEAFRWFDIFQTTHFTYLPLLYLLPWLIRRRTEKSSGATLPCLGLIIFGLLSLLLAKRFIFFLVPFFLVHLIGTLWHWIPAVPPLRPSAFWRRWQPPLLAVLLLLPALALHWQQNRNWLVEISRTDPDLIECQDYLRRETPPWSLIAAHWPHGYGIQTFARRMTLTDGFLEDPLNRQWIVELTNILFYGDETGLWNFCRRTGAGYLFLDRNSLIPAARRLKMPLDQWIREDKTPSGTMIRIRPAGRQLLYIRALFFPETLPGFRPIAIKGNYVILEMLSRQPPQALKKR